MDGIGHKFRSFIAKSLPSWIRFPPDFRGEIGRCMISGSRFHVIIGAKRFKKSGNVDVLCKSNQI